MERRVLVAVFLSFLVLYGYQALIGPPPPPPGPTESVPAETAPGVQSMPAAPAPGLTAGPTQIDPIVAIEPPTPDTVVGDTLLREIVVESDAFRAVFSNRGAELVSWQLKGYLEEEQEGEQLDELNLVELVPRDLPEGTPRPFSLSFVDESLTALAHEGLYRSSRVSLVLSDTSETLDFEFQDASGLTVHKRFTFDPELSPYVFMVTIEASQGADPLEPTVRWGPGLGGVESSASGFAFRQGPRGLIYGRVLEGGSFSELEIHRPDADDVMGQPIYQGQLDYVGVDNHYFMAVALPLQRDAVVRYGAVPLPPRVQGGDPRDLMAFDLMIPSGFTEVPFFLGPKDFDVLEDAAQPLVRSIDFGWLAVLVVPLHRTLTWVHDGLGNWGFSIIALTILINLLIFPLRHKSVVSMRKMQEIQPEMKAIQDRYKNLKATDPDKQKMNQEVMALYRDRGVNPASGCLPMLLTMPILFAFYRLLSMSIEMRGASFVGWITDLSVHDPFYVTPLIMGASMVLQQRLTPSQADPTQQKIMMLMPVVFTFMFLWAPSGLVLYWLTSNVLGIGQTVLTNRIIGPPKVKVVRPPAERRIKQNKGKGKSSKKSPKAGGK